MAAAKDKSEPKTVKMYALPGKTIQLATTVGVAGDKNKGTPPKAPKMRVVQPKTIFECTPSESSALIGQKAAVLASSLKKTKTAQEQTDESAAEADGGNDGAAGLPPAT